MSGMADTALMTQVPAPKEPGQRRMLALDGGGIRGVLSLEVLKRIEDMVKQEQGDDARLSDYFDYFAGTSTGALIATWLALGRTVDELLDIYIENGETIFAKASMPRRIVNRFQFRYGSRELTNYLKNELGADTPFGSADFKSLLLVVLHNINSDSPWPLSNNPAAKYNDPARADCNLRLPLWQVLRGSTAAPLYFPPETIKLGKAKFVFVDGGVTPYNNPAFQQFLSATQPGYRLEWQTGTDKLLLISVGTGRAAHTTHGTAASKMGAIFKAKTLPHTFMNGAAYQQDLSCRAIGHCVAGDPLGRELGDLTVDADGHDPAGRKFSYARFDGDLSMQGLTELGLAHLATPDQIAKLKKLDAIDNIEALREVGARVARKVTPEVFAGFPGLRA